MPTPLFLLKWSNNRLAILSDVLPAGRIEVLCFEAFCRSGSTSRRWEQTVIPHKTVQKGAEGVSSRIVLHTEVEGGMHVQQVLSADSLGVRIAMAAENRGPAWVDAQWGQHCVQLAWFTGRTQETYLDRCFLYTETAGRPVRRLLSDLPREEEAVYRGGQVFVPRGIPPEDVNPRPVSRVVPALPLIGAVSHDAKWQVGLTFNPVQELFQGVITCLHADFRLGGLQPGERKRANGRIWILPNEPELLLEAYQREFGQGGSM